MPSIKEITIPVGIACLLIIIINMLINYFQYNKTIVKLDNDIDKYNNDIPRKEVSEISITQKLKWGIIFSILNVAILGGIIWYITKTEKETGLEAESDNSTSI